MNTHSCEILIADISSDEYLTTFLELRLHEGIDDQPTVRVVFYDRTTGRPSITKVKVLDRYEQGEYDAPDSIQEYLIQMPSGHYLTLPHDYPCLSTGVNPYPSNKYLWMSWMSATLRRLRSGDISGAGNYLACCSLPNDLLDREWRARMFSHPEVMAKTHILWPEVKRPIFPEYHEELREQLRGLGWKI